MVKNSPSNAEDLGLIPGQGTKSNMPWGNEALGLPLEKAHAQRQGRRPERCNLGEPRAMMKTQCGQNVKKIITKK